MYMYVPMALVCSLVQQPSLSTKFWQNCCHTVLLFGIAATAAAIGAVILCGGGTRCSEAGGGGRTNRVHMVSVCAWLCVCDGGDDLLISVS